MNAIDSLRSCAARTAPWMLFWLSPFLLSCASTEDLRVETVQVCELTTTPLLPRKAPPRIDATVGDVFQERDRLRSAFALCEGDKAEMAEQIQREKAKGAEK